MATKGITEYKANTMSKDKRTLEFCHKVANTLWELAKLTKDITGKAELRLSIDEDGVSFYNHDSYIDESKIEFTADGRAMMAETGELVNPIEYRQTIVDLYYDVMTLIEK